jgi:hypothetical protein
MAIEPDDAPALFSASLATGWLIEHDTGSVTHCDEDTALTAPWEGGVMEWKGLEDGIQETLNEVFA